jgi:uncharacterized protein (DUF58 family)
VSSTREDAWAPTHALARCLAAVLLTAPVALLWRRPDLLVLITPCAVILAWSLVTRPADLPRRRLDLSHQVVREGEQVLVLAEVEPVEGAEVLAAACSPAPWVEGVATAGGREVLDPDGIPVQRTATVADARGSTTAGLRRLVIGLRMTRWGVRRVGPVQVAAVGAWGSYRWGPFSLEPMGVRALPQPVPFDSSAPAPHPRGLVGLHRSNRPGEGAEFAALRPFQVGDRLRRIHWPRSTRSAELHVRASYADQDTHVAVLLDAHYDLGASGGVRGEASSLDRSVRAAAAVAEHFLQQGDRVSLRVLSARTPLTVPTGTGRRHGVRILDTLSRVVPAVDEATDPRRVHLGVGEGTLVVMISALVSPDALTQAAMLARRGLSVVVIDALVGDHRGTGPVPSTDKDPLARAAWRIRMLERDREIRAVRAQGVAVVPWLGPGSLDVVLRELAHRGRRVGV